MERLKSLRDERGQKMEAMRDIDAKASQEQRVLTAEERAQWDAAHARLQELDAEISRLEVQEQINARLASSQGTNITPNSSQEKKDLSRYSFTKLVREMATGNVTGLEKEMHEEAVREAREGGVEIKNYGIPSIILGGQSRQNTVTQGTQPEDGAALVREEYKGMIDLLRDALVTRQLGAQYLTGLQGNVVFDKITQGATSNWEGEITELDESTLKFGGATMSPHRLGTFAVYSKQLLIQSSYAIEQLVRQELMDSVAREVDRAAILGSGTGNQPTGVLNTAGIGAVAVGANGGALTYNHIVALEAAIDAANANFGNLGYLINSKTKAALKTTKIDAGSGQFLMPGNTELNGYKAVLSNMVPSNLAKGTGTGLSAVVFGNWSDLIIGQWGGLDVMADPYTYATSGRIRVIVDSFWDVFVRRAVSFAAIKDATTTLA